MKKAPVQPSFGGKSTTTAKKTATATTTSPAKTSTTTTQASSSSLNKSPSKKPVATTTSSSSLNKSPSKKSTTTATTTTTTATRSRSKSPGAVAKKKTASTSKASAESEQIKKKREEAEAAALLEQKKEAEEKKKKEEEAAADLEARTKVHVFNFTQLMGVLEKDTLNLWKPKKQQDSDSDETQKPDPNDKYRGKRWPIVLQDENERVAAFFTHRGEAFLSKMSIWQDDPTTLLRKNIITALRWGKLLIIETDFLASPHQLVEQQLNRLYPGLYERIMSGDRSQIVDKELAKALVKKEEIEKEDLEPSRLNHPDFAVVFLCKKENWEKQDSAYKKLVQEGKGVLLEAKM